MASSSSPNQDPAPEPGPIPQPQSQACKPRHDVNDPDQQELSRIVRSFKSDVLGIINLGNDGVLRSLTADRDVLSAEGLSPRLIEKYFARFPHWEQRGLDDGVDGTKVPREKWFKPDAGILPPPLAAEHRVISEEGKEWWRKKLESETKYVDATGVLSQGDGGKKVGE